MALTLEMVQNMLDGLETKITTRINGFVLGEGQPIKDAIDAHHTVIIKQDARFVDHEQRMNALVEDFNTKTGQTIVELRRQSTLSTQTVDEVKRQQEVLAGQQAQAFQALNETQNLDSRLKELTAGLDEYKSGRDSLLGQMQADNTKLRTDVETEFNAHKSNVENWFNLAKAHIDGQGTSGGVGKGGPHGGHKSVNKKEIAV